MSNPILEVMTAGRDRYYLPEQDETSPFAVAGEHRREVCCVEIHEHKAQGEGDRWFYDIILAGHGTCIRVFDPVTVVSKATGPAAADAMLKEGKDA